MTRHFPDALCIVFAVALAAPARAQATQLTADDPFDAILRAVDQAKTRSAAERDALSGRIAALEAQVAALRQPAPPMRIGLNLSEWNDYGTAAQAVNVLSTFTGGGDENVGWGKPDKPWEPLPGLQRTPLGYPLQDAGSFGYANAYPDGIYSFRMEGAGDVTFGGKGRNVPGSFRRDATGALLGQVELRQARGGVLTIKFTGVDPADPPRNARLVIPGLPVETDQVFTPWFLDKVRPLAGTVRFIQWGRTNGSPHRQWANRKRPDEWTQTGARGVSYEHMARLANDLKADVWVCVPHAADDDYVRRMAVLFRDGLHADATVWLELSNELWNPGDGFGQCRWLVADARANADLLTPGSAAEDAAFHLKRVGDAWREVFAPQSSRVRPVLGGWQSDVRWARAGLEFLSRKYGAVRPFAAAVSSGGYVNVSAGADQPGLTADALFGDMRRVLTVAEKRGTDAHAALAREFGLDYVVYEGGQSLNGWNGDLRQPDGTTRPGWVNVELKSAAQSDPRMGELYRAMLDQQRAAGTRLFMHFASIEPNGKFGNWGVWQRVDSPDGPKAAALLDFVRQLPGSPP